jgi:hypothetical protein
LQEEAAPAAFVPETGALFLCRIPKFFERPAANAGEMEKQTGR